MPEASESLHEPVLLDAVLAHLNIDPKSDSVIVDGTVGLGGHAAAILERFPKVKLIGIDRDPESLELARRQLERFGDRATWRQGSYADLRRLAPDARPDCILLDLGYSSWQLDHRGFSFQAEAPLDLRYDASRGMSAAGLITRTPEPDLADLIYKFGEERASRRIAKALKQAKPQTTTALAETIAKAKPRRGKIHPATKTFQALRIAVNEELGQLERGLPAFEGALGTGGRLLVISFHSLEDRIVKRFIKDSDLTAINKKVIVASRAETARNPRARSAKLRVAAKTSPAESR